MPVHFSTLRLAVLVGEEIYDLKIESITQLARGGREEEPRVTHNMALRERGHRGCGWWVDKEEEEDTEKEQKRE